METISRDERLDLAVEAFDLGKYTSKAACAAAFDVKISTFKDRLNDIKSRTELLANSRKLSQTEELTLKGWILDMDRRGLPLTIFSVRHLAELLLQAKMKLSNSSFISDRWVHRYTQRHPELKSKFTSK